MFPPFAMRPHLAKILNTGFESSGSAHKGRMGGKTMEKTFKDLNDKSRTDRWVAVYALEKFGTPALDYLHKALADDDKWVRYAAVDALGNIGNSQSVQHVTKLLTDADQDVRFAAADTLGRIGDPKASHALMQTCNSDNCFVRIAAEEAFEKLASADKQITGSEKIRG
jgi:HEAT repeat protein